MSPPPMFESMPLARAITVCSPAFSSCTKTMRFASFGGMWVAPIKPGKVLFEISAPQSATRLPVDLEMIRNYIQRAEALGFHSIWVQGHIGVE